MSGAKQQADSQQGAQPQLSAKWVQPWWRTANQSAAAIAAGAGAGAAQLPSNAAQAGRRSWSLLGSLDGETLALIDRRGLLSTSAASAGTTTNATPTSSRTPAGWSVDWWFKAGADWVFPSQRSGVRQQLVKGAPVVETIVGTEGGEVKQRSFVARPAGSGGQLGSDQLVIEISNNSGAAIAVAMALRPYDQQGLGRIGTISVADGTVFLGENPELPDEAPDGILALQADRSPGEVVFGTGGIDPANVLVQQTRHPKVDPDNATPDDAAPSSAAKKSSASDEARAAGTTPQADENGVASVSCSLGMASVALVFPLVQGSVLRATMPLSHEQAALQSFSQLPDSERVASGWRKQSDTATQAQLGSTQLSSAFQAAKTGLPLAIRGETISAAPFGPATTNSDETLILTALAETGYVAAVREVLIARTRVAGRRGNIDWEGRDVTASSLIAAACLLTLHPDERLTAAFAEVATSSARWLLAMRQSQQRETRQTKRRSARPDQLVEQSTVEQAVEIRRGLNAAVELLELASASKAARNLRLEIKNLPTTPKRAATGPAAARPVSDGPVMAGPEATERVAPGNSNADAGGGTDNRASNGAGRGDSNTGRGMRGLLVADAQGGGNNLVATARLAFSEITSGQAIGQRRLESLLISASKSWSWPTVTGSPANLLAGQRADTPQAGGISHATDIPLAASAGHDLRINALVVRCVRAMLIHDSGPHFAQGSSVAGLGGGLDQQPCQLSIAHVWPDSWLGAEVEIQNFAARCGKVSWAVRWHGERPALLWEIKPHEHDGAGRDRSERDGQAPLLVLTAPGLDRTFISHDWEGEALLAAPANPRKR